MVTRQSAWREIGINRCVLRTREHIQRSPCLTVTLIRHACGQKVHEVRGTVWWAPANALEARPMMARPAAWCPMGENEGRWRPGSAFGATARPNNINFDPIPLILEHEPPVDVFRRRVWPAWSYAELEGLPATQSRLNQRFFAPDESEADTASSRRCAPASAASRAYP